TVWLLFYLFYVRVPYIEALAVTSLFKYGVWAVVMNILTLIVDGTLPWQGYMLIASHAAMAIQGLLYIPNYQFKLKHLKVARIFLLYNEIIVYVFVIISIYFLFTNYMYEFGFFCYLLYLFT